MDGPTDGELGRLRTRFRRGKKLLTKAEGRRLMQGLDNEQRRGLSDGDGHSNAGNGGDDGNGERDGGRR